MAGSRTGAVGRREQLRRVLRGVLPVVVALAALSLTPAEASAYTTGSVTPLLDCVTQNSDGTFTAVVGYTSTYTQTKSIPLGSNNSITPSKYNGKQPTSFKSGTHHGAFALTVSSYDAYYSDPTWYVDGQYLSAGWGTSLSSSCPLPTQLPAQGNDTGAGIALLVAGVIGVLVVVRLRRRALAAISSPRTSGEERIDA
jgi:hypothetical protein